jgi:hypothetical protein
MIGLATHLELRTGLTLANVSVASFKFDSVTNSLLFQKRDTKNFKYTQSQIKVLFERDSPDFIADLKVFLFLRKKSIEHLIKSGETDKEFAKNLPLLLKVKHADMGVKDALKLESFSVFFPSKISNSLCRNWFVNICAEAGIPNAKEKFQNKSIRCFLAAVQNENNISTWKRKDLVNLYDKSRSKYHKAVSQSLNVSCENVNSSSSSTSSSAEISASTESVSSSS